MKTNKICSICKTVKPLGEYHTSYFSPKGKEYLKSECKACRKAKSASRQISKKQKILENYGGCECCRCGFSDLRALSIDHISSNGADHRKSIGKMATLKFYDYLIANDFPKGYQVLCMNCQWIKRHENNEFRKRNI